jgi:phenylacetate-CoA ligase
MNEMGAFSFECERRSGFHLNTDACHVRIADEDGETVPDGVAGEVVISNLVNRATVILNYRTGDRAVMSSEPCSCGRTLPLLQELQGRVCDTIYCVDDRDVSYGLLAAPCGELLAMVSNFQIVQERRGHICWNLIPFPGTRQGDIASGLKRLTQKILPHPNEVEIRWVENIEVTPGQKRKFVVRRF